ncbi:MAG: hypothetical protein LBR33_01025 [Propionibacteriaceae bacterium]|jgi:ABC-2 type transport system permease protein|nr:hypothetical protein [Propionibacteriaceae bacterium]
MAERDGAGARAALGVAALVWRTNLRSALGWAGVVGVVIVFNALGYVRSFPAAADRQVAVSSMQSGGIRLLFGPAWHVDTVAGFTSWRAALLSLILSVWAIGTATRAYRGAEEVGSWKVLASGRLTRGEVFAATAGGLAALAGPVWLLVSAATALSALVTDSLQPVADYAFFGLILTLPPLVCLGLGALCSQVMPHRRSALGLAIAAVAALYLLRGVADVQDSAWAWASPFGWVERVEALVAPRYGVTALFILAAVVLFDLAWLGERRRDGAAALVRPRDERPDRLALLGSVVGAPLRLNARHIIGWCAGLSLLGVVTALVTDEGGRLTAASEQLSVILGETGEYDGAQGYLALVFVALGTVVALGGAGFTTSLLRQETSGQSRSILARPVRRLALVGADALTDVAALVVISAGAGTGVWLALLAQEADLSWAAAATAALTWLSAALVTYALGLAVLGWRPMFAPGLAYAFATCSFLLDIIGSAVKAPEWLLNLSFWHHVPDVPREQPGWGFCLWTGVAVAVLAGVGAAGYRRRDLA